LFIVILPADRRVEGERNFGSKGNCGTGEVKGLDNKRQVYKKITRSTIPISR
jgi:hypothetical protein